MITETLDKKTAKSIIKAKLAIFIPAILVGTFVGIYYATQDINISQKLLYGIVVPISIIISFTAAIFAAKLSTNKMIGSTFHLTNEDLIFNQIKIKKTIKVQEIKSSKENAFGLKVSSKSSSISIPKQLNNYAEFRKILKK